MPRFAIVNAANKLVLGSDEDREYVDDHREFLIECCSRHVAPTDTPEVRVFDLYRLRSHEGMSEADYYALPRTIEALLAAGAEVFATVVVPQGRDFITNSG